MVPCAALIFIIPVRTDENAAHHREGAERRGDLIAHNVAVVIFAGPDETADVRTHGDGVVDQSLEVRYAGRSKFFFILVVVKLRNMRLNSLSYVLHMVSLEENQRSCLTESAYWKHACAKDSIESVLLCMPWITRGP
jgi:hypothetical protein